MRLVGRGEDLPLIGRSEELAFLCAAITEQGGAVVGGAAGVGKTRLAHEVSSVLTGWHVTWATATQAAADLPLGGVAGLGLADDGMSVRGRPGLLSRLTATLAERAGGREILVVVDDAHLLDELSAAFVHHLATSHAVAVLLTTRTGEQPPSAVVSVFKDGPVPRLELEPLGQPEFRALASTALGGEIEPGTLYRLWSETAGNVLFLRELVADALEAGTLAQLDGLWRWTPDGRVGPRLAELVADRMGRLEGNRRLLAELLAVGEPLAAALDGPWPRAVGVYARGVRTSDAASVEASADAFAALGAGLVAAEAATQASWQWAASGCLTRAAAARAKAARFSVSESGCEVMFFPPMAEPPCLAVLTRREREVATLAGQGLANTDIAQRLVISVRTVESHLYSAYGKLDVAGRAELAAVFGSQYPAISATVKDQ